MDRWLLGLLGLWVQLLLGCLYGLALMILLEAVRRLITLHPSNAVRKFATFAYWGLASAGAVALYFVSLRHSRLPHAGYGIGAFYVGLALPFFARNGGFGSLYKALFRRAEPIKQVAEPAVEDLQPGPYKKFFERTMLSSKLSIVALGLWAISLALPAWTYEKDDGFTSGIAVLATGWIGVLGLQFAWFANLALWWAFFRIQGNRRAILPAGLAVFLSLNTLTLRYTPSASDVYGYGWGMVLWFMAIALMLAAAGAGAAALRTEHRATFETGDWLRPFGIGLSALVGIGAVVLSAADHQGANADERVRLKHVAVKVDEVCRIEFSEVVEPLTVGDGTVEVQLINNMPPRESSSGKDLLAKLLDWGVEKVRFEGRDFFYTQPGPHGVWVSAPTHEAASAVIELIEDNETLLMRVRAADGRQIVEQSWKKSMGKRASCPAYSLERSQGQQPQLLVSQALSIAPAAAVAHQHSTEQARANGQIVDRRVGPMTTPVRYSATDCPDDVGWLEQDKLPATVSSYAWPPLHIGERTYYSQSFRGGNAVCQGDYLYLYQDQGSEGVHTLSIEKRRTSDFSWIGATVINIQDNDLRSTVLQLDHITENAEGYSVDVSAPAKGLHFKVKASLGMSP